MFSARLDYQTERRYTSIIMVSLADFKELANIKLNQAECKFECPIILFRHIVYNIRDLRIVHPKKARFVLVAWQTQHKNMCLIERPMHFRNVQKCFANTKPSRLAEQPRSLALVRLKTTQL